MCRYIFSTTSNIFYIRVPICDFWRFNTLLAWYDQWALSGNIEWSIVGLPAVQYCFSYDLQWWLNCWPELWTAPSQTRSRYNWGNIHNKEQFLFILRGNRSKISQPLFLSYFILYWCSVKSIFKHLCLYLYNTTIHLCYQAFLKFSLTMIIIKFKSKMSHILFDLWPTASITQDLHL